MLPSLADPAPSLYDQLSVLPETLTVEIIAGELHTQPRPTGRHANAELGLGAALRIPFHKGSGGPGGWWIVSEPEIHFARDTVVVVPDLSGWRRARMPSLPDDQRFEVVPDWVCEVLSPSTMKMDRIQKLPLYASYAVSHVWLVDPLARTLEAYALRDAQWVLIATLQDADPVCVPPFDAITFSLADLWE